MNNKVSNPYLKQLISEIASKTSQGRITGVSWGLIDEAKKKKKIKEADEKKDEKPADDKGGDLPPLDAGGDKGADAGKDLPPLGGADEKPKDTKAPEGGDAPKADAAPDAGGEEDADKAEADAAEAKAKLAKAKAEKDQAEKEIEKHQYVKLASSGGTQFLLGKILDQAFKTNAIDALAGEMVEKLKIQTPEDMSSFSEDMATYMTIPGMPELLSSMKALATKQPEAPAEEPAA